MSVKNLLICAALLVSATLFCAWDIAAPKNTKPNGDHSVEVPAGKTLVVVITCKTSFMTKTWVEETDAKAAPEESKINTSTYSNKYRVNCKNPGTKAVKYCFKTFVKADAKDIEQSTMKIENAAAATTKPATKPATKTTPKPTVK